MKLIPIFLLLTIAYAAIADKSSENTQGTTLPPILIRYRIPDHNGKSFRPSHHTEFWGFNGPEKPLRFRQVTSSSSDSDKEKTLLEDDDITLKGLGKPIEDESKLKTANVKDEEEKPTIVKDVQKEEKTQDPITNEAEPNFRIFPYLLIGKTQTGDHFPFLAMLRDGSKKEVKDTQNGFVPAFVAIAPEPPQVKEEETTELIAAPILNLPMPLTHLARHASPLLPHNDDHHPRPEASFFRQEFEEPVQFRRPRMPIFLP